MTKRNLKPPWRTRWIYLLLIGFWISGTTSCSLNQKPQIVALGEIRAVGKIIKGAVSFEPGEDPNGSYLIITKGTLLRATWAVKETVILRAENEILKQKLEARNPK